MLWGVFCLEALKSEDFRNLKGEIGIQVFTRVIPGRLNGKESTCRAGDLGSIPGLGRSPGEANSCLENCGRVTVHGSQWVGHDLVTKSSSGTAQGGTQGENLLLWTQIFYSGDASVSSSIRLTPHKIQNWLRLAPVDSEGFSWKTVVLSAAWRFVSDVRVWEHMNGQRREDPWRHVASRYCIYELCSKLFVSKVTCSRKCKAVALYYSEFS